MNTSRVTLVFLLSALFCFYLTFVSSNSFSGVAVIRPTTYGATSNAQGTVTFAFSNSSGRVQVTVNVIGNFIDGTQYAIHVHQYGDLSDFINGTSAGPHFVGQGTTNHGCYPSTDRHEGDMGNWTANDGAIDITTEFDLLTLTGGFSIIGRSVVIHERYDNCSVSPTGNSGGRIAFGSIGMLNSADNVATNDFNTTLAVAVLTPTNATGTACSNCAGLFYFTQLFDQTGSPSGVQISGGISNIRDGLPHGLHVHSFGDLTNPSGSSAGAHWNPDNHLHNLPPYERHRGDLGNVQTYDSSNTAYYFDANNSYIGTVASIIGRALILHASFDHGNGTLCDQAGTSGARMAWGVIGVTNPGTAVPSLPVGVSINSTYIIQACPAPPSSSALAPSPSPGGSASTLSSFLDLFL